MEKKHVVKLTKRQRELASNVVDRLDGLPQKVKRAQILLKADQKADGWTDKQIAAAFRRPAKRSRMFGSVIVNPAETR